MAIPSNPDQCEARLHAEVGMTHVGFRVDDIEEAVQRIQQLGGELTNPPHEFEPQTEYAVEPAEEKLRKAARPVGRSHWKIAAFADADGIILELLERSTKPSGSRTPYAAESAAGGEYQLVWRRPAGVPYNPSDPRSSRCLT